MKLSPFLRTLVWGGESWTVSARRGESSVVSGGPADGTAFADIKPGFPLLVKVLDAQKRLSVQVHPNEATASLTGGEPKTEMWCVLRGGPIYAGLKPGTTARDLEKAIAEGVVEELLAKHDAKPFETYFIPGGLIHAIGDGVKVYEVQQSSETTYRLYDWGRLGADGKPRELHVALGLKSIDWSLPVPEPSESVRSKYFDFSQRILSRPEGISAPMDSFLIVYEVESGETSYLEPGEKMTAGPGRIFLTRLP
ncbi:MAG: class I mannose-6-phosphate isomerase [Kiritimatiellae bacterium]|nr:class I mannose-6-phosphate isomerase [Kiritimatiellia bacterium]